MVTVGKGGVHLVHGHGVHARHLVLLFPFHPTQNYSTLPLWDALFQSPLPPKKQRRPCIFPVIGSATFFSFLEALLGEVSILGKASNLGKATILSKACNLGKATILSKASVLGKVSI
jgi:hypothetical protein